MKESISKLIDQFIQNTALPLTPNEVDGFCTDHKIDTNRFCFMFSHHVADAFAKGEISYSHADLVINKLQASVPESMEGFPLKIYLAFDSGEYFRSHDPEGTVPWQKYTLPMIMEALIDEGLWPHHQS